MNVALIGYCGLHCSKLCWKMNECEALEDFTCPYGDGGECLESHAVSLAVSARHRNIHTGWPMRLSQSQPCTNPVIATKSPVAVTHHHYDTD